MRIDGKSIAATIFKTLQTDVSFLRKHNVIPHLAIILVGTDPASEAYVRQKKMKGEAIGMKVTIKHFSTSVTEKTLLTTIKQYNNDNNIHGLIIQQPLPLHIDAIKLVHATDPHKDVDGFHPQSSFTPPIAEAAIKILEENFSSTLLNPLLIGEGESPKATRVRSAQAGFLQWLKTKSIVIIGKGETGGAPVIAKLRNLGIEPTVIDSKTPNPDELTKKADIIISCVGRANIVRKESIKPGVILLSIGMFRGEDGKLHGDYEHEEIESIAGYYTPVPGGIGPVNVAMLLKNVKEAAENIG